MLPTRRTLVDVVERAGATFWQAFFAIILASGVADITALKAAGIAGGLAVGKYISIKAAAFLATPETQPAVDVQKVVSSLAAGGKQKRVVTTAGSMPPSTD